MKKVLSILLWLFIGLIIALALLPFVFKGKIQEAIKTEINENVNATVDFSDASISLFKDFPSLSVKLNDLKISGINNFEGTDLLKAKNIYLQTDLTSIIKSDAGINIYALTIDRPELMILVNESGEANYDLAKQKEKEDTAQPSVFGKIESYQIKDGSLSYIDLSSGHRASLENVDHEGSGKFKQIKFDLTTTTQIEEITFSSDGISYLNKAKLDSDMTLGIDLENQKYTFNENVSSINDLDLTFTGDVQLKDEDIVLDLEVAAPNNKVSSIISLILQAYSKDFAAVQSSGNSYLKGEVKGNYNAEKNLYPKVNLKINIDNGRLKYPDLSLPIEEINLAVLVNSTKSDLSDLSANLDKFTFLLNDDRVVGKMKVTEAFTNPHITGLIDGNLDLASLQTAFPIEDTNFKSGKVKANVTIDAKADDIINENYRAITFSGDILATNLDLVYGNYPISSEKISINLNPDKIESQLIETKIGQSDFNATADVSNPLAFVTEDAIATTELSGHSKLVDLDELNSFSDAEAETVDTLQDLSLYKTQNIALDYEIDRLKYEEYKIENLNLVGNYNDDNLTLQNTTMRLDDQDLAFRGEAKGVSEYIFNEETISGKFYFDANEFNANKYMSEDSSAADDITEPFIVPENLDIAIYPEINSLIYDDYIIKNTEAKIALKDGMAEITDGTASLLGGKVMIEGLYDSTNPDEPLFNLKYNMSNMDFGKVAATSKSFKILAPIVSYIDGIFNSTLVMSGPLKKDMMPDFTKVDAAGFLETLEGEINGFEPLEKVGNAIGVSKIKDWTLKGTKNWFDLKDGKVILKPHDHQVDDMIFTVAGTHSISQDLDYVINAKIPREKLKKDKLAKNVEYGMDYLEKEAKSRGVNIDLGEMIYLDIFLTGTLKNPKVKVLPVGSGGRTLNEVVKDEITKQVNVLKDTITKELENRTEVIKDTVTKVVEAKVDTVASQIKDKVNQEVEKQKVVLKEKLKTKLDTAITQVLTDTLQSKLESKAEEVLGAEVKESIDSLKSKIKDWNPFKKKKN